METTNNRVSPKIIYIHYTITYIQHDDLAHRTSPLMDFFSSLFVSTCRVFSLHVDAKKMMYDAEDMMQSMGGGYEG